MRAWSAALVLLLTAPNPLWGQTPRVYTEVDTTVVTVGDRITLTVSVDHPQGTRVVWPDSLNLAPFELLDARVLPGGAAPDGLRSSVALTLTAFELGDLEIPSFSVEVVDGAGTATTLHTDRFGIRIETVGLDEGSDIRELRGPLGIPRSVGSLLLIVMALLLTAGLVFLLYRRFRPRGPEGADGVSHHPSRPAHEVALEALARIEASTLLQRGQVKDFHIQLSEVLRVYIEARFWVPALEMTTVDILAGLRRAGIQTEIMEGFRVFFHQCDMVKFAKHRPTEEGSSALLAQGRGLVEDTIPEAEPEIQEVEETTPEPEPETQEAAP